MTHTSARTTGTLYIVATPIGNRDDISFRALQTLQSVDIILAEDTRHSLHLLTALGIKKPLQSLHAHNEVQRCEAIIAALFQGQSFALISDAGTPLISDPGFPLVRLANEHHIPVVPIPGASALITALSAAGVSCDTFTFAGFLPAKQAARRSKLESFLTLPHTLVFYESTHRILDCISDIAHVFGENCALVIAKELTKTFEHIESGHCKSVTDWLLAEPARCKGEFVVILPPREAPKTSQTPAHFLSILLAELPLKQAVKLAAQLTNEPKNELYDLALELRPSKK